MAALYIGRKAFVGCMGLKRVFIPNDTEIADDAFEGCQKVVIVKTSQ